MLLTPLDVKTYLKQGENKDKYMTNRVTIIIEKRILIATVKLITSNTIESYIKHY